MVTEERLEAVERRAEELERRMLRVEAAALDEAPVVVRPRVAEPERPRGAEPLEPQRGAVEAARPDRPARELDLAQLLGGRVLAWVGGVAILAGLALLFAFAVSRGWIGEGARTAIGFVLSAGLVALGAWLHGRRGRTTSAYAPSRCRTSARCRGAYDDPRYPRRSSAAPMIVSASMPWWR
jgi:uncharacterized membrane protein